MLSLSLRFSLYLKVSLLCPHLQLDRKEKKNPVCPIAEEAEILSKTEGATEVEERNEGGGGRMPWDL